MAVPFSNTKLRVPKGFQNILECLAREVLRSQPDNIHEFAASYFEKMLKVRTETGHDPALHGAKLEDRNYNNESFKKRSVDPSDPQQQQAAVSIQTQFRQHSAKGEVKAMREEDAATRIQAGFRGFIDREQVRTMKGDEPATEKEPAAEEEVDIDLNDPEVEKAAIKIQAGFKGFKARKDVTGKDDEQSQEPGAEATRAESAASEKQENKQEEEVDIDLADPDVAQAALRIQAGFRGHQARQEVMAQKTQQQEESPPAEQQQQQQPQGEEEVDIDLEDPATEKAALKIQASFRGFQTRRDMADQKAGDGATEQAQTADQTEAPAEPQAQQEQEQAPAAEAAPAPAAEQAAEEEVDIDLGDPEVEKAAMKIQAGFKGFKARKELQDKTSARDSDAVDGSAPAEDAPEEGSKVEGEGQEEVKASEEETQPKEVVEGEGEAQQQVAEEAAAPAEDKGGE